MLHTDSNMLALSSEVITCAGMKLWSLVRILYGSWCAAVVYGELHRYLKMLCGSEDYKFPSWHWYGTIHDSDSLESHSDYALLGNSRLSTPKVLFEM